MIKPIALTFALAAALAPGRASAQASGGYVGAPPPWVLAQRNACDGVQGATPIERPSLARIHRRPARPAATVPRSCCVTGMCTEGGGF